MARQERADVALAPVTEALLTFAAPRPGERVPDVGCDCPAAHVAALDISGPTLAAGAHARRGRRHRQCRPCCGVLGPRLKPARGPYLAVD